jgi:hypothetical protein
LNLWRCYISESVPQRLKPSTALAFFGTAEPVPSTSLIFVPIGTCELMEGQPTSPGCCNTFGAHKS